ncbi:MAG: alpha/beta fold hydrolase [Verrucomicrobiales bacterium]|nr:alpha/beta fold hydrolase [Verrucomicrobiales bacterium]
MIIALHGNIGSPADYDFLSDNHEVNPVNLWPYSHLSLQEVAAEIRNLAAPGERKGIIGYSMGGRIALQSIADQPDFWDFAVIISAQPGLQSEKQRKERLAKDENWSKKVRTKSWSEFLNEWNQQGVLAGPAPTNQNDLEPYKSHIASAFTNWSLGQQQDLRPELSKFRGSLTWIVGENDARFAEMGREMKTLIPNLQLIQVPQAGHRLLLESPDVISAVLNSRD